LLSPSGSFNPTIVNRELANSPIPFEWHFASHKMTIYHRNSKRFSVSLSLSFTFSGVFGKLKKSDSQKA